PSDVQHSCEVSKKWTAAPARVSILRNQTNSLSAGDVPCANGGMTMTPRRLLGLLALLGISAGERRAFADVPATTDAVNARPARTNLLLYTNGHGEERPVRSIQDWEQRRASILQAAQRIMGPLPGVEKRCPLAPETNEEVDCGKYVRRSITYASEPGARVPAFLLIPKTALTAGARAPAVLALHQTHAAGQKVVVGLGQSPNDEYGVELAERGFVVLAPPYAQLANYWPDLKALSYASGTMKSIWDNIRGLDYLMTLPFVRTNGFGAIGHSLGGHNSVFTAVFDQRIQVVVSSCGLDSFVDYYGGDPAVWKPE